MKGLDGKLEQKKTEPMTILRPLSLCVVKSIFKPSHLLLSNRASTCSFLYNSTFQDEIGWKSAPDKEEPLCSKDRTKSGSSLPLCEGLSCSPVQLHMCHMPDSQPEWYNPACSVLSIYHFDTCVFLSSTSPQSSATSDFALFLLPH